ncbi:hypothetical protein OUZ56_002636 [Daphnia magna]|uniref:Uncharacterized protein n=1 Tax=Daphnia magna TaxID=35525 RepID=A0ABR0A6B9_9CRUS|nr:hypothetical protein OUZ56_002636 [Daphnia magna]
MKRKDKHCHVQMLAIRREAAVVRWPASLQENSRYDSGRAERRCALTSKIVRASDVDLTRGVMLYCWRDPGDPRGESSAPPDVSTDYDDEKQNKRETLRRRKSRSALESNCQSDVGVIPQED